jgi:hypothetical protein
MLELFEFQKIPGTTKYRNKRFSVSWKLNTRRDFIGMHK